MTNIVMDSLDVDLHHVIQATEIIICGKKRALVQFDIQ